MNEGFIDMDNYFKQELKDYAPAPPADAWRLIEKKLLAKQAKRSPVFYFKIAASVALLIAATSVGINKLSKNQDSQIASAPQIISPNLEENKSKSITRPENSMPQASTKSTIKIPLASIPAEEHPPMLLPVDKQSAKTEKTEAMNPIAAIQAIIPVSKPHWNLEIPHATPEEIKQSYNAMLAVFDEPEKAVSTADKWAMGGQAGPQYAYRTISADAPAQLSETYNQNENGIMAYAGGVQVAFKAAPRFSVQSGVYYSKMGQTTASQQAVNVFNNRGEQIYNSPDAPSIGEYISEVNVSTSLGEIFNASSSTDVSSMDMAIQDNEKLAAYSQSSTLTQYLEYIEVPFIARYLIIDQDFNFSLLGGVSTNLLIDSPVYLDDGTYFTENEQINSVNLSSTVGLGFGYRLNDQLSLNIEPQFKYYLSPVNPGSTVEARPYSIGIFTGITYLF